MCKIKKKKKKYWEEISVDFCNHTVYISESVIYSAVSVWLHCALPCGVVWVHLCTKWDMKFINVRVCEAEAEAEELLLSHSA